MIGAGVLVAVASGITIIGLTVRGSGQTKPSASHTGHVSGTYTVELHDPRTSMCFLTAADASVVLGQPAKPGEQKAEVRTLAPDSALKAADPSASSSTYTDRFCVYFTDQSVSLPQLQIQTSLGVVNYRPSYCNPTQMDPSPIAIVTLSPSGCLITEQSTATGGASNEVVDLWTPGHNVSFTLYSNETPADARIRGLNFGAGLLAQAYGYKATGLSYGSF